MGAPSIPLRVGAAVLAVTILLWCPSPYINDETAQAWSLHEVAKGQFWLDGNFTPGFAAVSRDHGALYLQPSDKGALSGSFVLDLLALVPLGVLRVLGVIVGPYAGVAMVASAGFAWATHVFAARLPWRRLLVVAVAVLALMPALWIKAPAQPLQEVAALDLVGILAISVAAGLLADVLLRVLPERAAVWASLVAILATGILFWANLAKYHALTAFFVVAAVWCLSKESRWRWPSTFLVAGLALWQKPSNGAVLILALGVASVIDWRTPSIRRIAESGAGLVLGLAPFLAEKLFVHPPLTGTGATTAAAFVQPDFGSAGDAAVVAVTSGRNIGLPAWVENLRLLPVNLWQTLVWPNRILFQSPVVGFLILAPFLVLLVWGARRLPLRLRLLALVYLPLLLLAFGTNIYAGGLNLWDIRHAYSAWPLLGLLAAPAVGEVALRRSNRFLALAIGIALAFAVLALEVISLAHILRHTLTGYSFGAVVEPTRWVGLALAVALAIAWSLRRRGTRWSIVADGLLVAAVGVAFGTQLLLSFARWIDMQWAGHGPYAVGWLEPVARWVTTLVYGP